MTNWQPIETAPKDGTQILLSDGRAVEFAFWHARRQSWYVHLGNDPWEDIEAMYFPTHWQPLPAPPTEED